MTRMNRRDWLKMLGAGWLTAKLAQPAEAQAGQENPDVQTPDNTTPTPAAPDLMQTVSKTAAIPGRSGR